MTEDNNEIEWRRHLLNALDGLSKKVDENSAEHVIIRAEIAAVKADLAAVKASDPDKKFTDYVNSGRGWRMVVAGQLVALLVIVGTAIWNFSALTASVTSLHDNQVKNLKDVEDLKMTSIGYREYRLKQRIIDINDLKGLTK